jgi:hypothetical protein
MACQVRFLRPVFFVRWIDPQVGDVRDIERELKTSHERQGGPVIYIAIVPAECKPLDEKVRTAFINRMQEVLERCETMHFVMEGQGFKNAIMRSSLAAVLLVRGQRTKVFVHKALEDALASALTLASKETQFVIPQILRQARESGVATTPEAASAPG